MIEGPRPVTTSNHPSPTVKLPHIDVRWGFRERVTAIAVLVLIGYGLDIGRLVADAVAGSRTPMLALTPLLALLIASAYRWPPPGVNDNESDWLFVAILGTAGLGGILLVSSRFETMAALFRLDLVFGVLWAACATAIMLGARHAQRMWRIWLFAVLSANPALFGLMSGTLGGSDAAIAGVSVCYGATAVYLAGARTGRLKRLIGAGVCLGVGWFVVFVLVHTLPLFWLVTIAAAVVPAVIHIGTTRWAERERGGLPGDQPAYPVRSRSSVVALVLLAFLVAVVHAAPARPPAPAVVHGDWATKSGLYDEQEFPDAQRFLGPNARFVRYRVPVAVGLPAAAVDVITTSNLASLRDHRHTVWYPSTRPLNFVPATGLQNTPPVEVRAVFSNADTMIDPTTPQWYALTWDWRTDSGYQQVTVVVNQNVAESTTPPPAPEGLELVDTLLSPALWIGRQQPDGPAWVDETVVQRATEIADNLLANVSAGA
ncbi:hypothetical protein [Mycolicibacterium gilvum]|uniref:Transmembrane protein n=1 Tax=Mycolicibacterium gilvum (strain DSM 45189 / LMG 24558 / Spyr1) TaxID=278137 RepID=E6TA08_MYCSR|nr:hypothetical protein [Mycolicibacterium gilvum]ADT97280.1 hypothetical protein Mspyr1_05710 [Mycolicibacterium gilvum Spyr1]